VDDKSFDRRPVHALLALVAVTLLSGCSGASKGGKTTDPAAGIGQAAADAPAGVEMTLPRLGGGEVSLSRLRGHPVVVTLFTTWSLRCQAEAPLFTKMHERHRGQGLKVLGILLSDGTQERITRAATTIHL